MSDLLAPAKDAMSAVVPPLSSNSFAVQRNNFSEDDDAESTAADGATHFLSPVKTAGIATLNLASLLQEKHQTQEVSTLPFLS